MRSGKAMERLVDGKCSVYVMRDDDWDEYRVELWLDGEHQTAADYHTEDEFDALTTAEYMFAEATK